jgi:probable rRNA maturation factor
MSIHYFKEDVSSPKIDRKKLTNWIKQTIASEKKIIGEISFIFCSDNYLLEINKKFLNHDYFTDIITFDYVENGVISGDIFISCDRVKDNASEYKTDYLVELSRILIHGVLHLIGYKDKCEKDKLLMTQKEDYYLNCLLNS